MPKTKKKKGPKRPRNIYEQLLDKVTLEDIPDEVQAKWRAQEEARERTDSGLPPMIDAWFRWSQQENPPVLALDGTWTDPNSDEATEPSPERELN